MPANELEAMKLVERILMYFSCTRNKGTLQDFVNETAMKSRPSSFLALRCLSKASPT